MKPILTLRNGTEVIVTTGDMEAFKYGGGVVFKNISGVFWQFWAEREPGEKNFFVYTVEVPINVLEHYKATVEEICSVGDLDRREARRLVRSKLPQDRADLLFVLRDSRGPDGIAGAGESVSPWELSSRWGSVFGLEVDDVPKVDLDDYIVREHAVGYECGRVDGEYFGRFKTYEEALCAIANDLLKGNVGSNLFHEHEPGTVELVDWDPNVHAGRPSLQRKKLPTPLWQNAMKLYSNEFRAKMRKTRKPKSVMSTRRRETSRRKMDKFQEHARSIREMIESEA
jgi:hypothetical protein